MSGAPSLATHELPSQPPLDAPPATPRESEPAPQPRPAAPRRGPWRALARMVASTGALGLAMGAMLGGAALGVAHSARVADAAARRAPAVAPTPVAPSAPAVADEEAPADDEDDLPEPAAATPPGRARARGAGAANARAAAPAARGALDSAFYHVAPGRVTGYRAGRAFSFVVTLLDGKPVEVRTAAAFERMRAAAARAGLALRVVSGFRTMEHQRALYAAYRAGRGNLAALPGHSNHQAGNALDLNVRAPGVLPWLEAHAREFGFRRTVPRESWHWEHF